MKRERLPTDDARRRSRRRFLLGGAAIGGTALAACMSLGSATLFNSCRARLPADAALDELIGFAWQGIDPAEFVDCHVHLVGTGDSGSGIEVNPQMESLFHPLQYAQRLFYLNAGCVHNAPGRVDASYLERMQNLVDGLRPGAKLLLLAFERAYDEQGRPDFKRTSFYLPNAYAQAVVQRHPQYFEWAASIHPYRSDCVEELAAAVRGGARAVKWLPPAMAIDPSSPRCDRFYQALAQHDLPLITHAGEEKAVHGAELEALGNPLLLRRALDHGVRVVVAHCASLGMAADLDRGPHAAPVACFDLFARMMGEARYAKLLFADISALTLRNRPPETLRVLLEREEWHARLLNGSDYPLPGVVPLILPADLAARGLLPASLVARLELIREHNPLLFDFVLKRHLSSNGHRFPPGVFATRRFFDRRTA
ncbi:amidohydrolase family protein [Accumulibacter sp.]|uniref:amidohydrolase family protein n=2 Tax=Accumulibacter sp. TaxID=2053492 RepID=UPI00287B471F|nr:amidohydrolase family protein [Accumulibacter sp.]MDS4055088.1 amidohydrolase family protein [Accumulibacter sp.]HND39907.1 amidohydrolase family protein [Accumulibacter sp.]HNG87216.1 amidohydrolase family protein [Accumulibacter sp.]HNI51196.1 amidohydrolase family protein [Accumulibacter sp.]HNJ51117.1 amidohydrolase family protein [Accumulibacter sp.]